MRSNVGRYQPLSYVNRVNWQGGYFGAITRLCAMQQLHTMAIEFLSFGDHGACTVHRAHAAMGVLAGLADQPTCSSNSSSASCASVAGRACETTDAQSGRARDLVTPGTRLETRRNEWTTPLPQRYPQSGNARATPALPPHHVHPCRRAACMAPSCTAPAPLTSPTATACNATLHGRRPCSLSWRPPLRPCAAASCSTRPKRPWRGRLGRPVGPQPPTCLSLQTCGAGQGWRVLRACAVHGRVLGSCRVGWSCADTALTMAQPVLVLLTSIVMTRVLCHRTKQCR